MVSYGVCISSRSSILTTFYLIRHGVIVGLEQGRLHGVSESDLSERGYRMAELTAEAIRGIQLERIYSSPLRRTLQTAEALARVSGTAITVCAGLIEMDFGWFEGTRDHFRALREKPLLRCLYRRARRASMALTGESMTRFERRVAETWQSLRKAHPNGNIALVSHYGVIQQILLQSFGQGEQKPPYSYRILPASITELRCEKDRLELVRLSDVSHLQELEQAHH